MRTVENEVGGSSVFVAASDSLERVPPSHAALVTDRIREVFVDPPAYFQTIADSCRFASMASWLRALAQEARWELALHVAIPSELSVAGFAFHTRKVFGAEIGPSVGKASPQLPSAFQHYYSLVGHVHWMEFGHAGGLDGNADHTPLDTFPNEYNGAAIVPSETFVFGWSPGGDMLAYTQDDRAGWVSHETGKIHLLGSIEDTVNWVFAELLANRCPDFDYAWLS
jgi:hypothetical protein